MSISPENVVPNQSVTITGRGFSKGEAITKVLIGGTPIDQSQINRGVTGTDANIVDSGGNWVGTVIIPVNDSTKGSGDFEFKVEDDAGRPGVTTITIEDRTIDFTPEESRTGTTLTVSGTGWPAVNGNSIYNASVLVEYTVTGSGTAAASVSATPDSNGSFSADIKVPLNAPIPSTNKVTVSYNGRSRRPKARPIGYPGRTITITPSSGPGWDPSHTER